MKKLFAIYMVALMPLSCEKAAVEIHLKEGTKEINGTQLYYKVIGQGEPILIIHGGPGLSHDYLVPGIQSLADDHQLIFYDQRACGKSSLEVDPSSISIDNFLTDIDSIRIEFGIEKLNLMAHSWGGLLAMKYAIQYPEQINSLILVNSVGASSEISNRGNQIIAERFTTVDSIERAEILQSDEFQNREPESIEALMKIGFRNLLYDKALIDSIDLAVTQDFMQTGQLLQNLGKDLSAYDFHSELKKVKSPTLLIYGSFDPLTELAAPRIHESIDGSELRILDNCGHFPFVEKPEEFREISAIFLKVNGY